MIELAFLLKHFICDFPLQRPYQYLNKGKYGHLGGILHAGIHSLGTLLILLYFNFPIYWALVDGILHYHIDWLKVYVCNRFNLKPDNSDWFWHVLGIDQLLHYLTYALIIYNV